MAEYVFYQKVYSLPPFQPPGRPKWCISLGWVRKQ